MDWRVPFCCTLFALINLLTVSTGAARLAGVYTKRIATALTLFNTFILVSRMANLLMVPEIGRLADIARNQHTPGKLELQYRMILGSATLGCLAATLLIPTFVRIFEKGIAAFERTNSLPKIFFAIFDPRRSKKLLGIFLFSLLLGFAFPIFFLHADGKLAHLGMTGVLMPGLVFSFLIYFALASAYWIFHPTIFQKPSFMGVTLRSLKTIPNDFLILNIFVQAFWTVGWMSAVYAGALESKLAITAVSLSGIITGVSTIILTIFVDPKAALITDQAAHGIKTEEQIKAVVMFLVIGTVIGTLVAQILFKPASWLIVQVASHI
jgi:hypothetical protein